MIQVAPGKRTCILASFKVRRLANLTGGISTAGVFTSSGSNNFSGSTTLAGSTSACLLNISGSMKVGATGNMVTTLLHGVVSACVPAMNASSIGTGSAKISNMVANATLDIWLTSQGASGVSILTASAVSACCASMSFFSVAGATDASTMQFGYIAINP